MQKFADSMVSRKQRQRKRFFHAAAPVPDTGYFDAVEFIKWDDVKEPHIRFSDEG